MIKGRIRLRNYKGWEIMYFLAVDGDDTDEVLGEMEAVGCSLRVMSEVEDMLTGRCCDVGYSWSSLRRRKSLITISRTCTMFEFINTFAHEIDHIEKHIAKALRFSPYSERASYLVGEMVRDIFNDLIRKLLCR